MPEARDLPLIRFGEELRRRARSARRRRNRLAAILLLAGGVAATLAWPPAPRFVWNVSASAPRGLYLVRPGASVRRGDMVVAWLPKGTRRLAAARGYLPANVPLVKRVAALGGDRVCAAGEALFVNGTPIARRRGADTRGRPLPRWTGCLDLDFDDVLLLMNDAPGSFDGRYFGPVSMSAIVGKAVPLWVD